MEADSKRANVIFYNFDPSRRAKTLLEDVVAIFNQCIPNASIFLSDIKDVLRIKRNQKPHPILVKFTSPFCRAFVLKSVNILDTQKFGLRLTTQHENYLRERK